MEVIGSIYTEVSDDFQKGIIAGGISRCVKAEKHDLGVVLMSEVKVVGSLESKFESTNRIYDEGGCSPTLSTMQGGNQEPKILQKNPVCVAMRGRNPTNPTDRTPGIELEQTLEVNENGTSNCLTSVQKDNLVLEEKIPCKLNKMPFGHLDIMDNAEICDIGTETGSTLTARYHKGIGAHKDNMVMVEKIGQISNDGSQYGTVISDNGISANLVAGTHGYANSCISTEYRIRKLTPRECWRLMDFSDEDFEKAAEVNSNTQLYKQAGNSIVVNVLVAILGQLLPGKEDVYKEINK